MVGSGQSGCQIAEDLHLAGSGTTWTGASALRGGKFYYEDLESASASESVEV